MTSKKASLGFIWTTVFLDTLGVGLLVPILPDLFRHFGHDPQFVNFAFGMFISVYALMQFVASPVLGSLSDQYGRRPVLLISLLGAGLDYFLMAFAPSLWLLFVGRIISGLTGANMTIASSYVADISTDRDRSANFGKVGAAVGAGFILGPVAGGLLSTWGHQLPFLAAAVLTLANAAFGYFVLPESLPPSQRRKASWSRLNPLASLGKTLSPSPVLLLIWVVVLQALANQAYPSNWTLFTQYRFGWTAAQVGLSLAVVGITYAVGQLWVTRFAIRRFGERHALWLGSVFSIGSFGVISLATQGWMAYASMAFFMLAGPGEPALQSLISRQVPPEEQGELQGSLLSLRSLTSIAGPLLYTQLFTRFTLPEASFKIPGISYACAALLTLVSIGLILLWLRSSESALRSQTSEGTSHTPLAH